jgi:hypothetical protein
LTLVDAIETGAATVGLLPCEASKGVQTTFRAGGPISIAIADAHKHQFH